MAQPARTLRRKALSWLTMAAVLAFAGAVQAAPTAPLDPYDQVLQMRRGINILGYDPLWKPGGQARFQTRHFATIRKGGFDTVRVNLEAFSHMDGQDRLSGDWLKTLDWVVSSATQQGLTVILDEHNYNECGKDPQACRPRLLAFWRQIAERYRDAPNTVVFELLNEPNKGLTAEAWNGLLREALATVRSSNPTRNVVVGPAFWNNIDYLKFLDLPQDDQHLIVTVHYYLPMEFTHQGAAWNPDTVKLSGVTWGSAADRQRLDQDLDGVQAWSREHHRPILLGEFGAYDKGDIDSRVRYTAAVARGAEARGWAWAYWQFDSDFIAYDLDKDRWVEPIRAALIP
jgi:endoglucanase